VDNLKRLDESQEEEAQGVHHTLNIFENLIEAKPALARRLCEKTNILTFFLNRLSNKAFDANKLYCRYGARVRWPTVPFSLSARSANHVLLLFLTIRVRHSVAMYGQRLLFCDQSMREKDWRSRARGA
jgi:hypothetical protein